MSEHRTTVVARWPHTPLGTRVEIEVPDSCEIVGIAMELNEVVAELWKVTPAARLLRAISELVRKLVRR